MGCGSSTAAVVRSSSANAPTHPVPEPGHSNSASMPVQSSQASAAAVIDAETDVAALPSSGLSKHREDTHSTAQSSTTTFDASALPDDATLGMNRTISSTTVDAIVCDEADDLIRPVVDASQPRLDTDATMDSDANAAPQTPEAVVTKEQRDATPTIHAYAEGNVKGDDDRQHEAADANERSMIESDNPLETTFILESSSTLRASTPKRSSALADPLTTDGDETNQAAAHDLMTLQTLPLDDDGQLSDPETDRPAPDSGLSRTASSDSLANFRLQVDVGGSLGRHDPPVVAGKQSDEGEDADQTNGLVDDAELDRLLLLEQEADLADADELSNW
ncbi:uncharacterized protein MONBRDRAFT_30171 [Monosiga brevicollis MX1]|uniref:Uncharacterized protein n=1 Tax=Monosiga brevicollis TaxID=81824 RepID=A9VD75_MONBE|nr:uncharacterized protein MONBRDRAFT_30171 [Monosiga brevicollis MX1]EDQ84506.1 predicted protein [Monosiga brevicollis MX1]|eukprot:XP_001750693.1 hypothetical protein [Monosiga brevicollis MX1]